MEFLEYFALCQYCMSKTQNTFLSFLFVHSEKLKYPTDTVWISWVHHNAVTASEPQLTIVSSKHHPIRIWGTSGVRNQSECTLDSGFNFNLWT